MDVLKVQQKAHRGLDTMTKAGYTKKRILDLIKYRPRSLSELSHILGMNSGSVHQHLKELEANGEIKVLGYRLVGMRAGHRRNGSSWQKFYEINLLPPKKDDIRARDQAFK